MRLVLTVGFILLLGGCLGGNEIPDIRSISAVGGSVSPGWAYDGAGLTPASATLNGSLSNGENTGTIHVEFTYAGASWVVHFNEFAQAEGKTFQDGGVAFELDEHGDTGAGDALLPKLRANVATWGSASVMRDGALETSEPWTAHLMVSSNSVRGADGKITKADGTTPYDPATPTDARVADNDAQAMMSLKDPRGEGFTRDPAPVDVTLACAPPQCMQLAEISVERGASVLSLNITLAPTGPLPLAAGEGTLTFVDAAGTEVFPPYAFDVTPGPGPMSTHIEAPASGIVGPISVTLQGAGSYSANIEGSVTYDDHPFMVITWNEVTLT